MASTEQKSPIKGTIATRVRILYCMFVLLAIAIILKIGWIQYGPDGAELRERGEEASFRVFRVDASRGDIYSADMSLIATSERRYMVGIDFGARGFSREQFNKNVPELSRKLSAMFGDRSADSYARMLRNGYANRGHRRYLRITPRWVSYIELKRLEKFPQLSLSPNVGGRGVESEIERVRPYGILAGRTIGKTTTRQVELAKPTKDTSRSQTITANEVKPVSGLEFSFNDRLAGKSGWEVRQKINQNFWVPVENSLNVAPEDGLDIVTTLDMNIQDVAESMLRKQLLDYNADWGTVVVMDVATGEIQAIANLTNRNGQCVEDYNYAVSGRYEPGSTFKLASLLSLIEKGGMDLDDKVLTEGGRATIDNRLYVDDHKADTVTVKQMFAISSNIGFVKSVRETFRRNPARYVDYIKELGFKQPLGTGLGGEARPMMWEPSDKGANQWIENLTLNKMAYGYGFEISPLHTLTLYNAVANGGKMVRPRLVTEVRRYGQSVEEFDADYINRSICSSSTLNKVRECLESVVDSGTGSALKNPYYTVAAKTGTAQMLFTGAERNPSNPYYDKSGRRQYLATMVGYFPADKPRYSCIVCIKTYSGRTANIYGAGMAGPVFKAVADRIYAAHTEWQPTVADKYGKRTEVPMAVKGGSYESVRKVAGRLDARIEGGGRGTWVRTSRDSTQITLTQVDLDSDLVPNVVGMGAKDAVYLMEQRGLRVRLSGKGVVRQQSLTAGSRAVEGVTVNLTLN